MTNLRQRAASTTKAPAKRTSSRGVESPSKTKKYNEINIDSDSEDIAISEDEEQEEVVNDIVEDATSSSDISIDSDEDDSINSGSEDDKEIRRIIEKTEAETRNLPLTARQRATLEGGIQDTPTDSAAANIVSDEQALKNSEKSRRRKLQRDLKVEENKRATIDRLLQKQKKTPAVAVVDDYLDGQRDSDAKAKDIVPTGMVRLIDRPTDSFLQFPDTDTFHTAFPSKPSSTWKLRGCCQVCTKNQSKYTHPTTGTVFCSLSCYKLIK